MVSNSPNFANGQGGDKNSCPILVLMQILFFRFTKPRSLKTSVVETWRLTAIPFLNPVWFVSIRFAATAKPIRRSRRFCRSVKPPGGTGSSPASIRPRSNWDHEPLAGEPRTSAASLIVVWRPLDRRPLRRRTARIYFPQAPRKREQKRHRTPSPCFFYARNPPGFWSPVSNRGIGGRQRP